LILSAKRPRQLDRRRPDAARPTVDQYAIACSQAGPLEEIGPYREERLGNRRSGRHVHPRGDRKALRRRHGAEFRVSSSRDQRADPVAVPPSVPMSCGNDGSGDLEPRDVGRAGRRRVLTQPLHDVGAIHAGRFDADEHLARLRLRHRPLGRLKRFRPSGGRDFNNQHGREFGARIE
jgi:hypothetical protein